MRKFLSFLAFASLLSLSAGVWAQGPGQPGRPQGPSSPQNGPGRMGPGGGPSGPGDWLSEGERELRRERYVQARRAFEQAPGSPRSQYMLGEYFLRVGRRDSAMAAFRKGMALDPEDWMCKVGLGQALLETSATEAAAIFDEVSNSRKLRREVKVPVRIARAYLSVKNPDFPMVRSWLDKALAINNSEPEIFMVEGDMYFKQLKAGEAVASYRNVLFYEPDNYEAQYKLGRIYRQAREYDQASDYLAKALERDSLHVPSLRVMGEMNYFRREYPRSIDAYRRLFRLGGGDFEDRASYASALFFNGQIEEARPEYERLLRENPNHPSVLRVKAYIHQMTNENEEGVRTMERFFSVVDTALILSGDYQEYGRLLLGIGKDSLGYTNYLKAIRRSENEPNKRMLFREMADSIQKRKQNELADYFFSEAEGLLGRLETSQYLTWGRICYDAARMRLEKTGPLPQDTLVAVRYFTRADSLFAKVAELAPDNFTGLYYRATALDALDRRIQETTLAKPLYEKLLENPRIGDREKKQAYLYLAYASSHVEDYPQALVYYKKYLELDPGHAEVTKVVQGLEEFLKAQK